LVDTIQGLARHPQAAENAIEDVIYALEDGADPFAHIDFWCKRISWCIWCKDTGKEGGVMKIRKACAVST
jgi:hypothetical protein